MNSPKTIANEINTDILTPDKLRKIFSELNVGEKILLSGTVYTSRDAAHKKIFEIIEEGKKLPFEFENSIIYYAGPTPQREGMVIGSCGPTTSSRMDKFAPKLYDMGVLATIGKGERSKEVIEACQRNKAVYLCAIGGCGALASKCIIENTVIAFEELGCESVKKLKFSNFPLIVAVDTNGNSLFNKDEVKLSLINN